MIIVKIYLILLFVLSIFTVGIGTEVFAADSGVSLGVTVLSAGPATINDFDYHNLNQIYEEKNQGKVMGAKSDESPA